MPLTGISIIKDEHKLISWWDPLAKSQFGGAGVGWSRRRKLESHTLLSKVAGSERKLHKEAGGQSWSPSNQSRYKMSYLKNEKAELDHL